MYLHRMRISYPDFPSLSPYLPSKPSVCGCDRVPQGWPRTYSLDLVVTLGHLGQRCLLVLVPACLLTYLSHIASGFSNGRHVFCEKRLLGIAPVVILISIDYIDFMQDTAVYGTFVFWVGLFLIPAFCLSRDLAWKMAKRSFAGSLREQVMQLEQIDVDPGRMIRASYSAKVSDRTAFMRILRRTRGSEALLNLCPGATIGRTRTLSIPSPICPLHGYAFSQEEHGVVRQSDLIRAYDSTRMKPEGR
ncbi:hypothetical protein PHET_02852 [Paragonimus heterotremus]|uniref:Uncharacterized protein n=1 Tax=Paragonimus heterotremus TaxID=100268 RepID=A0A8J4SRP7_9TREM|nr:hypothetical protein PHET_02852 [Paragonimus heterotremus]